VSDLDELEEQRFVERLLAHDERAFNQLVRSYEERVFRLMFRMVGRRDEAEDLAQEVFVQVFKAIGQFRGDSKLGTWVYRIAINLCKNRLKYLARRHSEAQDELEPLMERRPLTGSGVGNIARPDQVVEGYQAEAIVRTALEGLDPEFREVLILRDLEDLSYEEIGQITNLAEGTVKSRIHRGRALLKVRVEELLGEKIG
jgi:RNA polymerase sigma-70 factor, ECF subfamily